MIAGMDFGTTNSGMAVFDGRTARVLPIDPSNANPGVARTALYITTEQGVHIGREALDLYFEQNIGRPVRMQKVWVGELEVIADEVYYVTDVYTWADVLSPGRLFLSIKSGLRDEKYPGTMIGQFHYSLENLIALYLYAAKLRAERVLRRPLTEVVLGRPVRFATDPKHDRLAEARLLQAAFRAGYERVYLQHEPVAAAYSYEQTLSRPENVLVFDFGGGTLDITIMRLGGNERKVLATGGIPVAGDVFDQKLVRAKLPRHFGEGSRYGPRHKSMTVPQWIFDSFSDWQRILELQSAENRKIIRDIAQTAQRRYQIEALMSLVSGNYGLRMFDVVEQAKRTLSEKNGAPIYLDGPGFNVREFVTRGEFENIIRTEIRAIEDHLGETVLASGLKPDEIDTVIRTGGSAQIPAFYDILARTFGAEKINSIDTFTSVTAGLGISAYRQQEGEIELTPHTPDEFENIGETTGGRLKVTPVNLDLLQRRIELSEKQAAGEDVTAAETALVLLGDPGGKEDAVADILVHIMPLQQQKEELPLAQIGWGDQPVRQGVLAAPGDQLVFITSRYRFLLASARHLHEAQEMGLQLRDIHPLIGREVVSAVANWTHIQQAEKLLLATSTGFVRTYSLEVLRLNIEAPTPFRFDNPLEGLPVLAAGVTAADHVVVVTEGGRGVRWPVDSLPSIGLQAINCGKGDKFDRATAAAHAGPDDELVLVLEDGFGRRLLAGWVPEPPKGNTRGRSLVARKSAVVGLSQAGGTNTPLATTSHLALADATTILFDDSTRTELLLRVANDESVTAVLSGRPS